MQQQTNATIERRSNRMRGRIWLVLMVALAELGHLAWEHAHGGIASHHLLNNGNLPAIWNGWGLLLLPTLTWFLGGRTERRIAAHPDTRKARIRAIAGFCMALVVGAVLSGAFAQGLESVAATTFFSIFALALLLPAYRPECVLGFVLAMTFTFGAVLPTMIACVIAAVSALAHLAVHRLLAPGWRRIRAGRSQPAAR